VVKDLSPHRRVAVHASVEVAAPADRVWPVLTDWDRHAEWIPFTEARGGHEVGATLEGWTGVGPVGFLDTMVITAWQPPGSGTRGRVAVRHTGQAVRGEGRFDVEPLPGGRCRVVWGELLELPLGLLGRAGWIAAGPMVRLMMEASLRRLAKIVI
jgi:Polyketide cyclase / dehydrase and lipid transport